MNKKLIGRMVEIDRKYNHGFLPSSLSALPIIEEIYSNFKDAEDVFILSKGHAALALYAVLEEKGYKPKVENSHILRDTENGIFCSTGSLGHGLPIAAGVALAKKIKNEPGLVHVLLGDGECQEGTLWETIIFANENGLDNLMIYIDNNSYQGSKKVCPDIIKLVERIKNFSVAKIIIKTRIKGYGLKALETRPWLHAFRMSDKDYEQVLEELK